MTLPLPPDLRAQLGTVIREARRVAEAGATEALAALAVDRPKPFDSMSLPDRALRNALRNRGRQAGDKRNRATGAHQITRLAHEAAYEHWHRMLFARFLAENELLIASEYGVAVTLEDCQELARETGRDPWELAGEWAQAMLPEIFAADDRVFDLAFPPETRQKLEALLESLPAEVFTARDSLGWTYQYWRSEEKDRVNTSGIKIGADEIPAVTQLFTERYMVLFLLHNTIGAWRAGKILADDPALASSASEEETLRQQMRFGSGGGYDFAYLRLTRPKAAGDEGGERTGPWRPAAGTFPDWPRSARDLRVLDPCCGSGHFLVEAFELLVRLRMDEEGLGAPDAVRAVLRDNLFGLEIDRRCTEIAAFNLALAAWRLAGERIELPALSIACCGIAPEGSEAGWVRLAEELEGLTGLAEDPDLFGREPSLARGPLQEGMRRLHHLFRQARELGSLIDPETVGGELFRAGYDDLKKLLDAAIKRERRTGSRNERAVAAAGMARAAKILTGRYTLVVTNVPFLARGKQGAVLRRFAETHHGHAKGDIATVFASRIFRWLGDRGTQALVTPQNWLFLTTYRKLRERLLKERKWNVVVRLGEHAFADTQAAGAFAALVVLSAGKPEPDWEMAAVDVSSPRGQPPIKAAEKARLLGGDARMVESVQERQLSNPDSAVVLQEVPDFPPISRIAEVYYGSKPGRTTQVTRRFWEVGWSHDQNMWQFMHSSPDGTDKHYTGQSKLCLSLKAIENQKIAEFGVRGREAWHRSGVVFSKMSQLPSAIYRGHFFDDNTYSIVPRETSSVATALFSFARSRAFPSSLRAINQKLNVTRSLVRQVPFDLDHWTKIAAECYPNGLPEPYSDDPTQWIFHGDPCRSVIWDERAKRIARGPTRFGQTVLQVAVARLLGYRWPAELDADMRLAPEQRALVDRCATYRDLADADGIVCLSPVRDEGSGADRLRKLLSGAYGNEWSAATERRLLAATTPNGRAPKSLELWLRDKFFAEHCKLFHNRPFVWHIWDGRKDGFHALVNYHRLAGPGDEGRRTLESLTYAYLNHWIEAAPLC